MHAVIIDDLEEYLSGSLRAAALARFQGHLDTCGDCRREVEEIQQASSLLGSLKHAEPMEPPPGFTARVMRDLAEEPATSWWNVFGAFGRQAVFASLVALAVLGTVLVSREKSYQPEPTTPQAAMAADVNSPSADQMLVTLANYEP